MAGAPSGAKTFEQRGKKLDRKEILKLEKYFQSRFNMPAMTVKQRPQKDDSAEVYIEDEFIGVVFRDDEDGDLSYNFTMAILDIDLE
jgi:Protein of unknown function (DUF3126)